jgi:hypothetical protein
MEIGLKPILLDGPAFTSIIANRFVPDAAGRKCSNAAPARGARDLDAARARLLAPDGTRANATAATRGSNCPSARDVRGDGGEAARGESSRRRAPAASPSSWSRPRPTTASRGRAEASGLGRARLLDPDGTRVHAIRRRHARTAPAGAQARGEADEAAPGSGRNVSNCVKRAPAPSRASWSCPRATTASRRRAGTRDPVATRARLLDPDGTRARATPATNASNLHAGSGPACASAVVIPAEVVPNAVTLATEKVTSENRTRAVLLQGDYLRDLYAKYCVM